MTSQAPRAGTQQAGADGPEPGQYRMRIGLQVGQRDPLGFRVRVRRVSGVLT